MQEFIDRLKAFFKSKLNICLVALIVLFVVMVALPIKSVIFNKIAMALLAVVMGILAYKFFMKHRKMKEIYENLDSVRQEKKGTTFSKISDKIEGASRLNNLTYALVFGAIAVLIVVYIIIK